MKLVLFGLCALLLINCRSVAPITNEAGVFKTVTINTKDISLGKSSKWFGEEALQQIKSSKMIEEEGEDILDQVTIGYKNQIGNFTFVKQDEIADVTFKIKSIEVKRGRFTFNFLKPGPIYIMKIEADVLSGGRVVQTLTKKVVVNMAAVVFPEETTKWMKPSEKRIVDNQLMTFNTGLRKLYQNLYFEAFDISLSL